VVFGFHFVELLIPHMNFFLGMLILVLENGMCIFKVMVFVLDVKKGVVILLEMMVLLLEFLEMVSGLSKLVLSCFVFIVVKFLSFF